jgi:hypothetical protein
MSDLQALHAEAGGLLQICMVASTDVPELLLSALSGNRDAKRLLSVMSDTLAHIQKAPKKQPALCVACPRAQRKGRFMLAIALPACDDPTNGLGFGVCDGCSGGKIGQAEAKAVDGLRAIWPDLRPVRITDPVGGRA